MSESAGHRGPCTWVQPYNRRAGTPEPRRFRLDCVSLAGTSGTFGAVAADSDRRAAHQRVGRIKHHGVTRLETRDNLDGAAIVPANLDRRQLHAPISHERNPQTF